MIKKIAILLGFLVFSFTVKAETPINQTQQFLNNNQERNQYINQSGEAKKADDYAGSVVGDQNKDEMYKISSEIFPQIAGQGNNDPEKMKAILEKAQNDPEAFFNSLPEAQKQKIRDLAGKVPQPNRP